MLRIRSVEVLFVFDDADWSVLSMALKATFPDAVYFPASLKSPLAGGRMAPGEPILVFNSLLDLFEASPTGSCSFYIRDPWPEDLASGAPLDLIGGYDMGSMMGTVEGFHRHGRCVAFGRNGIGVGSTRLASSPDYTGGLAVDRLGTLPASAYGDTECYRDPFFSGLYAQYNANEAALKDFAHDVSRLVQRHGTRSIALYNPITSEILDDKYKMRKVFIGWNVLKRACEPTGTYLLTQINETGGDKHPRRKGAVGLIGPRPNHPVVRSWKKKLAQAVSFRAAR